MLPLFALVIGTILCFSAWIFVFMRFDPFIDGWQAHLLFYASLGLALQGTLMLVSMVHYKMRSGTYATRERVRILTRQTALFVSFLILILMLAGHQLLRWWNVLPLALLFFIAELFFLSVSERRPRSLLPRV